jgi:hypothetical protein
MTTNLRDLDFDKANALLQFIRGFIWTGVMKPGLTNDLQDLLTKLVMTPEERKKANIPFTDADLRGEIRVVKRWLEDMPAILEAWWLRELQEEATKENEEQEAERVLEYGRGVSPELHVDNLRGLEEDDGGR